MKTDFLGLKMKNPVIVSAGPWNRDGRSIRKGIAAGAGAVITETIVSDALLDVRPRIAFNGQGAQNIRLYSDIQVEGWQREMDIAKSKEGIVIASVSAHTPSELAYLAMKMEKFGADAIELGISSPMGESLEVVASDAERVYEMTKEVVRNVKIPVIAKLSQNATNISKVAKAVKSAGGSGVSAINTVRCILGVDIETAEPTLSTYGGYSGAPIRPLGLASVASIAQAVDIPICGIGGIENYKNVLEYIMLGASAVEIGTAVMVYGFERITEIVNDLENWAEGKGIKE
ncbi:MAG TPA: tRNA-dihydrouridine synthase, partial [Anaerovoracaceae bacterium]|nr:tRNA-dihydrouridine synthase [Anaerovoracaceae bacterium]